MDLIQLKKLVSLGEGEFIEFKRKVADPVKIAREMVAFANKSGGTLFIGVNDDGSIPGLKYPEEEAFIMLETLNKYCKPKLEYTLTYVPLNAKKKVLAFDVKEAKAKPVYLLYDLRRKIGKAYIRVADRSVQTSREVRRVLKARNTNKEFSFSYGEKERVLMKLLDANQQIDLNTFAEIAGITQQMASETLVNLTLSNVILQHPGEINDLYTMNEYPNGNH